MYVRPTAPRSIGGVLDDGLRLWIHSLSRTWPLALLAQLLLVIPLLLFRLQIKNMPIVPTPNALSAMNAANAQLMLALMKSPGFWLGYLLVLLLYLAFYNAIILRIFAASTNGDLPIGRSVTSGLRLVPREALLILIGFLALIVVGIALALIFAVTAAVVGAGGQKSLTPLLMGIFSVLVIGFLMTRLFLTLIALVLQDARAFESLSVSWTLTRGNFWRCAAILTVLIIIGIVLSLVIGFLNGLLVVWLGPDSLIAIVLSQVLGLLSGLVLGPLYPAVSVAVYFDLKLRKEGADLASRVNALPAQ